MKREREREIEKRLLKKKKKRGEKKKEFPFRLCVGVSAGDSPRPDFIPFMCLFSLPLSGERRKKKRGEGTMVWNCMKSGCLYHGHKSFLHELESE